VFFFYWLIAIMPLEDHPFWGQEIVGTLTMVKLVGLLCVFAAVIRMFTTGSMPSFFGSTSSWWYAAYFLLQFCSLLVHGGRIPTYSLILSDSFLFVVTLTLVDSTLRLRGSLLVAIGAVGFTSLYAIREWQKYHGMYVGFRAWGMLSDANEYAVFVGLWIPLAFLWAFGKRPWWEKIFCLGCLASCLLGTSFAASRGGFLGLVASFLLLIWHSRRRVRNLALLGVLLLPLGLLNFTSAWNRLLHPSYGDKVGQQARLVAWQVGWKMIKAHPLFGVGLGNFKAIMPGYQESVPKVVSIAHNTYVETAAELGIPGLIVFLGIWVSSLRMLGRLRRTAQTARLPSFSALALGLQAGMVSYLVQSFFVSAWWYRMCWLLLFLALCLDRLAKAAPVPRIHASMAGANGKTPPTCKSQKEDASRQAVLPKPLWGAVTSPSPRPIQNRSAW
jgi:O-antigen ligase